MAVMGNAFLKINSYIVTHKTIYALLGFQKDILLERVQLPSDKL